jgi:hypothetical protein
MDRNCTVVNDGRKCVLLAKQFQVCIMRHLPLRNLTGMSTPDMCLEIVVPASVTLPHTDHNHTKSRGSYPVFQVVACKRTCPEMLEWDQGRIKHWIL